MTNLSLTVRAQSMFIFSPVLQDGLRIRADVGCSIRQFLIDTLAISSNYIEERIATIMLDGKAIDDLDAAILEDNSVLALSSAMPGLAGATLRRKGHLSSMRSGITYHEIKKSQSPYKGTITLKFFNLLTREVGLKILDLGVTMNRMDLLALLKRLFVPLKENCTKMMIDDRAVTAVELLDLKALNDSHEIFVQIKSDMTADH